MNRAIGRRLRNELSDDNGPVSGSFTDSPSAPGKYWYGIHVVDNAGNWNDQKNSNTNGQPSSFEPVVVDVKETTGASRQPTQPVTLTLYVNSSEWVYDYSDWAGYVGPVISGAQVTGQDGSGNKFQQTASSNGPVTIVGKPGTWSFTASADGYVTVSWDQEIDKADTKHAFLQELIGGFPISNPLNFQKVHVLKHEDWVGNVASVAFSPDGNKLATIGDGSINCTIHIWDVATGMKLLKLNQDSDVDSVAFSPDGSKIAATSAANNTIFIWDAATGMKLLKLNQDSDVDSVAFSSDGSKIITSDGDNVGIWDIATKTELKLNQDNDVYSVAISPDGGKIAAAVANSTIFIWDVATRMELQKLADHSQCVLSMSFSHDGSKLATGGCCAGENCTATVWDVATGAKLKEFYSEYGLGSVAFSPDGSMLASESGAIIYIWDVTSGTELFKLNLWDLAKLTAIHSITFSPDGRKLAACTGETACILEKRST